MKKTALILVIAVASGLTFQYFSRAVEPSSFQVAEFATIRWDGRDHSFVVRPNGKTELLKGLFGRLPRPEGMDERVYYMNAAMNAIAKEGYDFAGMTQEQIVMRRTTVRQ